MMRKVLFSLLLLTTVVRADGPWQFAVISDVHLYQSGEMPRHFKETVAELVKRKPRFVLIDGDSTCGNADDKFSLPEVRAWWTEFKAALEPLHKAGIPVLPVAGNHDYYREFHRQAYAEAWSRLSEAVAPITLSGNPPRFYSFDVDGVHFMMLHIVDEVLNADVESWLKQDLVSPAATSSRLRFAFGHVPLHSVMGHTDAAFEQKLGQLLLSGGTTAYIAGHEHLIWDERLLIQDRHLRQITVGTASGSYTFPLSEQTYAAHCHGSVCTLPTSGAKIHVDPTSRLEREKVTYLLVDINPDGYKTHFMGLGSSGNFAELGGL